MANIGLLGLGTVGTGVYEIIKDRNEYFKKILGEELNVKKILVRNLSKERKLLVGESVLTTDPEEILNDDDIDIVVEVLGGIGDAYKYIKTALNKNKHVITANKAVVALYLEEFLDISNRTGKGFLFEASVGGGIPIIKPLKQSLNTNDIDEITGILNGTTNFILTKMYEEGLDFDKALKLAQDLGYAEADPTDDIEGYDVARKLSILSSIGFKNNTNVSKIKCRGISNLITKDIDAFKSRNFAVKVLGKAKVSDTNILASVEPVLINKDSQYATVKDAYNVVSIKGNVVGDLKFYGKGAGKEPTANAVVSDIIDILNGSYKLDRINIEKNLDLDENKVFEGKYYIRLTPNDLYTPSDINEKISEIDIEYETIINDGDVIILTEIIEGNQLIDLLDTTDNMIKDCFYLRIEEI